MEDWRLQGQEKYLMNIILCREKYIKYRDEWDHDHCAFCGKKFSENQCDLHEGYTTADHYHWICDTCFKDFKEDFHWKLLLDE